MLCFQSYCYFLFHPCYLAFEPSTATEGSFGDWTIDWRQFVESFRILIGEMIECTLLRGRYFRTSTFERMRILVYEIEVSSWLFLVGCFYLVEWNVFIHLLLVDIKGLPTINIWIINGFWSLCGESEKECMRISLLLGELRFLGSASFFSCTFFTFFDLTTKATASPLLSTPTDRPTSLLVFTDERYDLLMNICFCFP